MRIVITDAATVLDDNISLNVFRQFGEVTLYDVTSPEELPERIKDAEVVLCNKTPLTAEAMEQAPHLRYIGLFATGYNNIDTAYTSAHGITVCNVPGYSTEAVAQHTFAFILALINRIGEYNQTVAEGDWIRSRTFSYFPLPIAELCGKTIGIIGYGAIGRRVGDIAKAFGMTVLVNNRRPVNDDTVTQVDLDTLLKTADIVSLHCPLNEDSKGIMNTDAFAKMKKGSFLVNTARGPLVDEKALREALESGHLAGAGVDVLCVEPMEPTCPLLNAPNCLITPHIAWAGAETRRRLLSIMQDNINAYLAGNPINTVG